LAQVEAWYDEYASAVLGLASYILDDRRIAEAVTIEVFVAAQREGAMWSHGRCRDRLLALTRSHAVRRIREQGHARPTRRFRRTTWPLNQLQPLHRDLIHAAYFEGDTVDDLVLRFGMSRPEVLAAMRDGMADVGCAVARRDAQQVDGRSDDHRGGRA